MSKTNLRAIFDLLRPGEEPHPVLTLNGQTLRLMKPAEAYRWHIHPGADELFLVLSGKAQVEFRNRTVTLEAGECLVVKQGEQHRTRSDQNAMLMILAPSDLATCFVER